MVKKFNKMCAILVTTAMILCMLAAGPSTVSANNTSYYVDSVNGSDSNSGTSTGAAWRTLSKVNNTTFQPGDRILFKAGCTWNGQLWPKGSGAIGNPIVIDMYGSGNKPLINGGGQKLDNMATNPGFEAGNLNGWNASYGTTSAVNNNQHGGSYCAKIGAGSAVQRVITGLKPASPYKLKAWVKVVNQADVVYVGAKDYGINYDTGLMLDGAYSTSSTTYKQISLTFWTGYNNTTATVYVYRSSTGSGYAYTDDIEVIDLTKGDQTFKLSNQQYWEVNNLEITNWGTKSEIRRRAVYIEGVNAGTLNHIYLYNLDVHDVNGNDLGEDPTYSDPMWDNKRNDYESGGIIILVIGDPNTPKVQTKFNDVKVEGCTVRNVSKTGILIRSYYQLRGAVTWASAIGDWYPSTNVVFRNNSLDTIGGDGIIVCESQNPLIEYNVAKDCHNDPDFWNVAIWSENTDDAIFQNNEAYGTKTTNDGQGFDIDWNQSRITMQYNYSHDNEGGFMLVCCWEGDAFCNDHTIRYNISQNDKERIFEMHGRIQNTKVYNNTIYVEDGPEIALVNMDRWEVPGGPGNISFNNNIFYNLGNGYYYFNEAQNIVFDYNCFYGNHPSNEPADPHKITSNPLLVNPGSGGTGRNTLDGYKLQSTSPCINAGVNITNNGGKDFWGNPVPYNGQTDIGAFECKGGLPSGTDRCTGGTITASSEDSESEDRNKAFDDNVNTKWYAYGKTPWIIYDFAGTTKYAINKYTITSANDVPERDPKSWTLQGSNNGTTWTTVDTRTNVTFASRFLKQTFSFTNSTAYSMYRFNISDNNGATDTQLAEIEMFDQ